MWDVTEDQSLNKAGLFQTIRYTSYLDQNLAPELRDRYLSTVKIALDDLAFIKNNPDYCQFLSDEMDYPFAQGFKNFENAPLDIHLLYDSSSLIETALFDKESYNYSFGMACSDYSLKNRSNDTLKSVIAHELGHALIYSTVDAPLEKTSTHAATASLHGAYSKDHKKNWSLEFTADKIAVASDPQNDIGAFLSEESAAYTPINQAYQRKKFPKTIARALSAFCMTRDHILLTATDLVSKRDIHDLNDQFKMNCNITHPADIARAVRGETFAAKCANFLKNQKS